MGYSSHLVLVVNKMDMCLDTNCWLLHVCRLMIIIIIIIMGITLVSMAN